MKIYIDKDYKCYISDDGTMREFESDFFDGKCKEFIEGYHYIPKGEYWVNSQGKECSGISPWKDYDKLKEAQLIYEKEQATAALNILVGEE